MSYVITDQLPIETKINYGNIIKRMYDISTDQLPIEPKTNSVYS